MESVVLVRQGKVSPNLTLEQSKQGYSWSYYQNTWKKKYFKGFPSDVEKIREGLWSETAETSMMNKFMEVMGNQKGTTIRRYQETREYL